MFGYACDETDVLMPAPIYYSHKILELMALDRKNGKAKNLEPDSKSQVTLKYENGVPAKVTAVVISTQHSPDISQSQVKEIVRPYLEKAIPKKLLSGLKDENFYVNPTGQFIIGGPDGTQVLQEEKLLLILMVEQHVMVEARFLEKIQAKLIDQQHMLRDICQKCCGLKNCEKM